MTREIPRRSGARTDITCSNDDNRSKKEVLETMGVTEQDANRWEQVASIPEEHTLHPASAGFFVACLQQMPIDGFFVGSRLNRFVSY